MLEYLITDRVDYDTLPIEANTIEPEGLSNPIPIERRLEWLIERLRQDDVNTVRVALETVFQDAWGKAKTSRSRKKNKIIEEMDKQPLIKLPKI